MLECVGLLLNEGLPRSVQDDGTRHVAVEQDRPRCRLRLWLWLCWLLLFSLFCSLLALLALLALV